MISLGFLSLQTFAHSCGSRDAIDKDSVLRIPGYGPLLPDPQRVLDLPDGFSYKIISKEGDLMNDGFLVPGLADGMATFQGENGKVIIIRNHEVSLGDNGHGAFGKDLSLLDRLSPENFYDYGQGRFPCLGGTTTMVFDQNSEEVEKTFLSLVGTIRNCAGGSTPWNSWITCEEDVSIANDKLEKNHGYNFEVPATAEVSLTDPVPISGMGRFNHEAVCVDPQSGIVYQTEDRSDGLIYRYLPNSRGRLHDGGRLQVLVLKDKDRQDTRNWKAPYHIETNVEYATQWLDIDGIDSPDDDLRHRGKDMGAAVFARGEGMWFGDNELYFACTNGGRKKNGQVFRYQPSKKEGQPGEKDIPGKLTLFIEPNNTDLVQSCDNVTVAPNGHLILCEDRSTPRIVGVTTEGKLYHVAKNVGYRSEFAGACFSPDGSTLFVNIQGPGLTLAINGLWNQIG